MPDETRDGRGDAVAVSSAWARLKATTPARIGLGRAGDALQTRDLLAFQLAHGQARDAVHASLDVDAIAAALPAPSIRVRSQAGDRQIYLRRPDLGRRLDPGSLGNLPRGTYDAVFVIADGLSATAVHRHAGALLHAVRARLDDWRLAPIVIATQARVALGDEIGAALGARLSVMIIGERPGLSVADSLGVYLTYDPRPGRRDSERNCLSNIHSAGLSYNSAADKLCWLMRAARERHLTGIELKEETDAFPSPPQARLGREA